MKLNKCFPILLVVCALFLVSDISGKEKELVNENLLKVFEYRALGPAKQGGRILDVVVPESQPYTFYVSTASGGLWKTENNGTTFKSIFVNPGKMPIGDVAVSSSDPNIIWVGTGTAASGRISLLGDGVYKSTDGGQTWKHMGLKETRHIGRIVIHPATKPGYRLCGGLGLSLFLQRGEGIVQDNGWRKDMGKVPLHQ